MRPSRSIVVRMQVPAETGRRLMRMASCHGLTPGDASVRLVEEGLRRSEFAFIDFRDSSVGRQAYLQGSGLAVWEVMLLVRSYKNNLGAVARHLNWPVFKVQAAVNYAAAFSQEIGEALAENDASNITGLKRMLRQIVEFTIKKTN